MRFGKVGAAVGVGEQPIKCLVDPAAGARMSVGEALANLVFAPITELRVSEVWQSGLGSGCWGAAHQVSGRPCGGGPHVRGGGPG